VTPTRPHGVLRRSGGWLATAVALLLAVLANVPTSGAPEREATAVLDMFLARPLVPSQYRATRHLEAQGGGQRGWLDVATEFAPGSGMHYTITAQGGSGLIRSRILRSLLDEEQELIARGAADTVAIAHKNYEFGMEGTSTDGLQRVTLKPRRKERALIAGTMFLMPGDGELVRVEGKLAKSPSLWMKRVEVVRSYARINGILVPTSLDSIAHMRLLGRSSMRMAYRYTEIDNQPVIEPSAP
jgi:hypothetical protein